ncbi:MAG: hypothetical protein GY855_03425, partial [candidate division Zixibacteria bacterium]|nr:hypothetical protein [candidate division Zixibacteria bacterium]
MINIIKKFTFSSIFVVFLMVFTFVAVDSCTEKKTTDNGAGIPDPPTGISLEDFSDWSSTDWIVFIHSHVDSIDTLTSGLYLIKSD